MKLTIIVKFRMDEKDVVEFCDVLDKLEDIEILEYECFDEDDELVELESIE